MKVYARSLGCPKNKVDTEHLLGSLGVEIELVAEPSEAELAFVNTCGFIQPAVEESLAVILETAQDMGSPRRGLLVVAGCLVGRYGAAELAEIGEVDLWLPTNDMADWPRRLAAALGAKADRGRFIEAGPAYAYIKVGEGCRHACTFCTIPSIRGRLRSTPLQALADEATSLAAAGKRELVLVAQDLTAYGADLDMSRGLITLLETLAKTPRLDWIRPLYLYPAGIDATLLAAMAEMAPTVLPYFDVPLQHGHPEILSRMGRPFSREPLRVVERIREAIPEAALRTSLIVGFPGETDAHFAALMELVEKARFHNLGVFSFWPEDGTAAAEMAGQVPEEVKTERREAVMALQARISEELLAERTGTRERVLIDAPSPEWPGLFVGRTWFQAPEIDGVSYVSGEGCAVGELVDVEIVDAKTYDLVGLA